VTKGRTDPVWYLQATAWDIVLAALFAAIHYQWISLPAQIAEHLPGWLLPGLALFFLLSGLWSYGKYRRLYARLNRR